MSGEGTGGGGALAVLLALWVGATAFIVVQEPWRGDREPASGEPIVVETEEVVVLEDEPEPDPTPTPTPRPQPQLPECEGDACAAPVTRAELAAALARTFSLPVTTRDFFRDDDEVPQQAAINRVAAAGVTSGCGDGLFCPGGTVTRAQMATFLDRLLALPEADRDHFADDDGLGHEAAINRVAAAGLTAGCGEDRFCPDGEVTMSQLIRFLERAIGFGQAPA